jgi:hypothetical protein
LNLPYIIALEHVTQASVEESIIEPTGLHLVVPTHLLKATLTIPVQDNENGLDGEIVLFRASEGAAAEKKLADEIAIRSTEGDTEAEERSYLLRGGFFVGPVPGLPDFGLSPHPLACVEVRRNRDRPNALPTTNLSRSELVEEPEIGSAIFRIWLDALLQSLKKIERRPIGSPEINQQALRGASWLQRYSALDLYRLAKSCWMSQFQGDTKAKAAVKQWEAGRGKPLWLSHSHPRSLYWHIFELVLPNLTELRVANGRYLVCPLRKGWKDKLKNCHTFINEALSWGQFVSYIDDEEEFLWDAYSGHRFLNAKYQDKFANFTFAEVHRMRNLFDRLGLYKSIGQQTLLNPSDVDLMRRVVAAAGDLKVNRFDEQYTVASLVLGIR